VILKVLLLLNLFKAKSERLGEIIYPRQQIWMGAIQKTESQNPKSLTIRQISIEEKSLTTNKLTNDQ